MIHTLWKQVRSTFVPFLLNKCHDRVKIKIEDRWGRPGENTTPFNKDCNFKTDGYWSRNVITNDAPGPKYWHLPPECMLLFKGLFHPHVTEPQIPCFWGKYGKKTWHFYGRQGRHYKQREPRKKKGGGHPHLYCVQGSTEIIMCTVPKKTKKTKRTWLSKCNSAILFWPLPSHALC